MEESLCAYHDCGRAVYCRKVCRSHYGQLRAGKPLTPVRWRWGAKVGAVCDFKECDKDVQSSGLCRGHYAQQQRGASLRPLRDVSLAGINDGPCSFDECPSRSVARGLCGSHYEMHRTGEELRPLRYYGTGLTPRAYALRANYNISVADYDAMLTAQGGVCAVCGNRCSSGKALAVDHDHACCPESGKSCGKCVRGLLCAKCNTGIGHLRDSADALRAAADYLDNYVTRATLVAA